MTAAAPVPRGRPADDDDPAFGHNEAACDGCHLGEQEQRAQDEKCEAGADYKPMTAGAHAVPPVPEGVEQACEPGSPR